MGGLSETDTFFSWSIWITSSLIETWVCYDEVPGVFVSPSRLYKICRETLARMEVKPCCARTATATRFLCTPIHITSCMTLAHSVESKKSSFACPRWHFARRPRLSRYAPGARRLFRKHKTLPSILLLILQDMLGRGGEDGHHGKSGQHGRGTTQSIASKAKWIKPLTESGGEMETPHPILWA